MPGEANENKAVDNKTNITLVGQMLGMELKADGIGSEVDTTNMTQKLNEKAGVQDEPMRCLEAWWKQLFSKTKTSII